ncbi:hypothetical protein H2201_007603 [Coniosporium apollinis]|uniref:Uncharacterized protein n=1 Tax=Coniosporium apollinis TaxID=61459 RepID=A0ABQ9NJ29_9PEZI|nr:hypothetical protein H2201_007603 [Coniosporium apollinis]
MRKESKINSLFLTAGFMTLKGRQESTEGLDTKMAINYYSRIRFAQQLMPLLEAAASANEIARVTSVLAAGSEHEIHTDDLDLKHNYSLHCSLAHCVVMTDFMLEELSRRHPAVTFMHCYPGTMKTGIVNQLTGPIRLAAKIFYSLMTPWILDVSESGERHLFQVTSCAYRSPANGAGVLLVDGLEVMMASTGERGGGVYLLDWDSDPLDQKGIMERYREEGLPQKVWEHTMEAFGRASKKRTLAVAEMLS